MSHNPNIEDRDMVLTHLTYWSFAATGYIDVDDGELVCDHSQEATGKRHSAWCTGELVRDIGPAKEGNRVMVKIVGDQLTMFYKTDEDGEWTDDKYVFHLTHQMPVIVDG